MFCFGVGCCCNIGFWFVWVWVYFGWRCLRFDLGFGLRVCLWLFLGFVLGGCDELV